MQSPWQSVTYAEGFAGPGIYQGGEPGSPVRAADVFLRRRYFLDSGKALCMVLLEEDKRRLDRLQQEMQAWLDRETRPPPSTLRVAYRQGECATALLPLLQDVRAFQGPIFAFLDSFGGPDIPLHVARAIAGVRASEVLVTFGTSFLTRFGADPAYQPAGDEVFGSRHWRRVLELPAAEKKPFLVTAYRKSLTAAGFTHVISFEMVDDSGHDLHLVFGTSNPKGLEKMKDAMWKVDPVHGVHYRDPRDPDQLTFDIGVQPNLAPLRRELLAELVRGSRTVAQLQHYALTETMYRGPHVRPALTAMLHAELVERHPPDGPLRATTRISITTRGTQHISQQQQRFF